MKYFNDLVLGDVVWSKAITVSRESIVSMAQQFDPQPLHVDEAFAQQGLFGDVIACSAHLFCIMSQLSSTLPEADRYAMVAGLGFDQGKLLAPVKPGDELRVRLEVAGLRRSRSKPMWGIVEIRHDLYNQDEVQVFSVSTNALIELQAPVVSA